MSIKLEVTEQEKSAGIAPQLLHALYAEANLIAHGNQDPATPLPRLHYSQGIYGGFITIIRALEAAGVQCPTR